MAYALPDPPKKYKMYCVCEKDLLAKDIPKRGLAKHFAPLGEMLTRQMARDISLIRDKRPDQNGYFKNSVFALPQEWREVYFIQDESYFMPKVAVQGFCVIMKQVEATWEVLKVHNLGLVVPMLSKKIGHLHGVALLDEIDHVEMDRYHELPTAYSNAFSFTHRTCDELPDGENGWDEDSVCDPPAPRAESASEDWSDNEVTSPTNGQRRHREQCCCLV
ncbi:unnamed protein product [Sphagnum tenellum]